MAAIVTPQKNVKSIPPTSSPYHPDQATPAPFPVPIGPRPSTKPAWSYAALIGQSINAAPSKRASLSQIYNWISTAYPFYKRSEAGWQNSIRHNLSLNECFVKIKREEGEKGKGCWWGI
ncbi:winged helix DNA-binding domain-containing protein, partial [Calocera cornea HHB12733]